MPAVANSPNSIRFFSFLDRTINILIIDDTAEVLEYLAFVFSQVKIFNVQTARNAKSAAKILQSEPRIHQVTLDLGISDINNDEFGLLKEYGDKAHFVVVTGQNDTEKGGQCILHGAKGVLHKPMELSDLLPRVNTYALQSILAPRRKMDPDSLFTRSLKHLIDRSPRTVIDWATDLGVTDSGLWRASDEAHGVPVKLILLVYQTYSAGFKYYENLIFQPGKPALPISKDEYDRLSNRFISGKKELKPIFK